MPKKTKKTDTTAEEAGAAEADAVPRLSAHPRARRQIARAKAWAGLGLLVAVALLSRRAGLPWFDALVRGLLAGLLGYLGVWAAAVAVWRHIARAELELMARKVEQRRREAAEDAERIAEERRQEREAQNA